MRDLSLRTRVVVTAALLLGAATAAPLVVLPGRLEARDRQEEERRGLEVARAFAAASEVAVDFGDRMRAAEVLAGLAQVQGSVHGRLLGADGALLAAWGAPPAGAASAGPGPRSAVAIEDGLLTAAAPVVTRSGLRGELQLWLGLEGLQRRRDEARAIVGATSAVVFVAGLVVAGALFRLLLRPLERVTAVAGRIARGEQGAARHLDASGGGEAGAVASALGGVVDQLMSQQAVLEAQNEASSDGLLMLGLDGRVMAHNRRLSRLWWLDGASLAGAPWSALLGRLRPLLATPLPDWLAVAAPTPPADPAVLALRTADGRLIDLHVARVRLPGGTPLGLGLTFRDVTVVRQAEERVRSINAELEVRVANRTRELAQANEALELRLDELQRTRDQLVQADRAIAVGRLAAGVAHEINNPLAYVAANLHFVQESLPSAADVAAVAEARGQAPVPLEELKLALGEAIEGTSRVARIVRDLKAYSRPAPETRVPTSLAEAMEVALSMASNELRHRAAVVRDYRPAPPALADPIRLSQVFLNLLLNASQAVPQGEADRHQVTVRVGAGPEGWPFAEVTDDGTGIAPEVLGKVFDPFFTTKPQGQGTGLGLAVSQGIVSGLDGRLEVESALGRGSTFRVRLPPAQPWAEERTAAAAPQEEQPAGPPGAARAGRLLVVDDEPTIGAGVRRMCAGLFEVEATTCPRGALQRIQAGERFDVVLCDLMMPVMNGMEFEAEVAKVDAAQAARIVFMTGGAFTEAAEAFVERRAGRVLAKPFDLAQLRKALHGAT